MTIFSLHKITFRLWVFSTGDQQGYSGNPDPLHGSCGGADSHQGLDNHAAAKYVATLPEDIRKGLLHGPISPDKLFRPILPDAVNHLQQISEEVEKVRRHLS